jgi:transposase
MADEEGARIGRRVRRFRSVSEKRRVAELTFEPGASVALVARAHGVNANQVFKWRCELKRGELVEPVSASTALLPVSLSAPCETANEIVAAGAKEQATPGGAIHIEFSGRAMISVESGADPALLHSILTTLASNDRLQGDPALESLRK